MKTFFPAPLLLAALLAPAAALPPAPPAASPAARAAWSYTDTGNPADPAYKADFSLERDVFAEAAGLRGNGLKALIAWDIDLTLGTPLAPSVKTSLASDPWWNRQSEALLAAFTAAYGPRKDADGKLLWAPETQARYDFRYGQLISLNNALHERVTLVPVEDFVPAAIRRAQLAGVHMLAVTARGPDMERATQQDISVDLGLDFTLTSPGGPSFSLVNFKAGEKARPSTYRRGVLMTSGQNKGEQLLYIFSRTGYWPDAVFFLDDGVKNAKDVLAALAAAGIETHVVRYGFEDARVAEYNAPGGVQPCVAQAQLEAYRATGSFPPDAGVKEPRCDAAHNFELIYGTADPAR